VEYFLSNGRVLEALARRHSARVGMPGLRPVSDVNTQGGGIVGKRNGNGTDIGHESDHIPGLFVLAFLDSLDGG